MFFKFFFVFSEDLFSKGRISFQILNILSVNTTFNFILTSLFISSKSNNCLQIGLWKEKIKIIWKKNLLISNHNSLSNNVSQFCKKFIISRFDCYGSFKLMFGFIFSHRLIGFKFSEKFKMSLFINAIESINWWVVRNSFDKNFSSFRKYSLESFS